MPAHRRSQVCHTTVLLVLAALASGCGRLDGTELDGLSAQVFRDFDTNPDALPATVAQMDALLAQLDLEGRRKKRSFELEKLGAEFHADVTTAPGLDEAGQVGFGVGAVSRHSVGDNMEAQSQPDQVCINADVVKCHRRELLTDEACFLDGTCDELRTWNTLLIKTPLPDFWLEAPVDFRRVQLPDGREAVVSRTWLEQGFLSKGGNSEWNARFGVDLFVEDPDDPARTRRWYATWLGGKVDGASNRWVARAIYSGLDEGFENPDDWLDGKECKVDTSQCEFPEL